MRILLLIIFLSLFVFACTQEAEESTEMMSETESMEGPKVEALPDWDSLPPIETMLSDAGSIEGPKVEALPDWDSLPPIEEIVDEAGATVMEKAEEMKKKE